MARSQGPQVRSHRLPPMTNQQPARVGTARSKSAESTRRPSRGNDSTAYGPATDNQVSQLSHQFQVLTTEVYKLAKQKNKEKIQSLAQELHAKGRVVDALVDDHRRINQDLQKISSELSLSRQEHQNVAKNMDAIVNHINTKMPALASAAASAAAGTSGQQQDGSVANAQSAVDLDAVRQLLGRLVQNQQQQAQGTAAMGQKEARKSAILFSAVVQMGKVVDSVRGELQNQLQGLSNQINRSLGITNDANEDPLAVRALTTKEAAALEARLRQQLQQTAQQVAQALADERQRALEDVSRRRNEDRKLLNGVGIDAQKLKIQLQLESQQRQALESSHKQWLSQLRDGLVASGEAAGARIAAVLAQVEQTASASRAATQQAVDQQREQLLSELEKRAVELRDVEAALNSAVRDAEDRLIEKIATRQTAAETNAHRLVQRYDTLEAEVRTITDAVTRSLSGLKDSHGTRLKELETVIKAEITSRQKEQQATKARLEGVIASITRAIDAVQENTADDLRELDERLLKTATAVNNTAQQGRQAMQKDFDRDIGYIIERLERLEDQLEKQKTNEDDAAEAKAEAQQFDDERAVRETMDKLLVGVELAVAQETTKDLESAVTTLQGDLEIEKQRRLELEELVNELRNQKDNEKKDDDDVDWQASVAAATAWLQKAAAGSDASDDNNSDSPEEKKDPKVRVRADVFED